MGVGGPLGGGSSSAVSVGEVEGVPRCPGVPTCRSSDPGTRRCRERRQRRRRQGHQAVEEEKKEEATVEVAGTARKRRAVVEVAGRRPTVVDLAAVGRKRRAARGWKRRVTCAGAARRLAAGANVGRRWGRR
jgi:hypothetical protein